MTHRQPHGAKRGFTLIELMVTAAVLLILLTLAVPSIKDLVGGQRLQSVNTGLVTDLQFARSEAARRQLQLSWTVSSNADQSCYVLFIDGGFNGGCDCLRTSGSICTGSYEELRSFRLPASTGLTLRASPAAQTRINFFPLPQTPTGATTARYVDPPDWRIELTGSALGTLRNTVSATGAVSTCSPDGSVRKVPTCG